MLMYDTAFFRQRTIMDADHVADGYIFGGKESQPEPSGLVVKRNFYLPHLHFAPPFGVIASEFRR